MERDARMKPRQRRGGARTTYPSQVMFTLYAVGVERPKAVPGEWLLTSGTRRGEMSGSPAEWCGLGTGPGARVT